MTGFLVVRCTYPFVWNVSGRICQGGIFLVEMYQERMFLVRMFIVDLTCFPALIETSILGRNVSGCLTQGRMFLVEMYHARMFLVRMFLVGMFLVKMFLFGMF